MVGPALYPCSPPTSIRSANRGSLVLLNRQIHCLILRAVVVVVVALFAHPVRDSESLTAHLVKCSVHYLFLFLPPVRLCAPFPDFSLQSCACSTANANLECHLIEQGMTLHSDNSSNTNIAYMDVLITHNTDVI